MGQELEFNVRYVRGKGVQITQLGTRSSRVYWISIGITLGLTVSNLAYHFTQSIPRGVEISTSALVGNMLGQIVYLVILHRRYKAMLKEIGLTEKQMLATMDKSISEGEERMEVLKREARSRLEEMERELEDKWGSK